MCAVSGRVIPISGNYLISVSQPEIWGSGLEQEVHAIVKTTGEPYVTSLIPGEESVNNRPHWIPRQDNSAYELWQIQKKKAALRQEYLDYWNASIGFTGTGRPIDAVISPVAPSTAAPHGHNT